MNNNVKSATTAGLLGIFLGSIGAHDWYLGNKKKGTIHVCLAASGLVVSLIADVVLPSALSYRALLSAAVLISILGAISAIIMTANAIWGLAEGIQILMQGDAGLAQKGYMVAQPNMNYGNGNNGYCNQSMNNSGMQQNMNNGTMNGTMNGNMNNQNQNVNNNNGFNNGFGNGSQNGQ